MSLSSKNAPSGNTRLWTDTNSVVSARSEMKEQKGLLIQSGGIREGSQEEVIPELNFEGQVGLN